jgi:hypothetical protein
MKEAQTANVSSSEAEQSHYLALNLILRTPLLLCERFRDHDFSLATS